jgi:hypothetical protein
MKKGVDAMTVVMDAQLLREGFERRDVPDGGDCFYLALADQLARLNERETLTGQVLSRAGWVTGQVRSHAASRLRQNIASFQLSNPALISPLLDRDTYATLDAYVAHMRTEHTSDGPGAWAGEEELISAANMLGVNIRCYTITDTDTRDCVYAPATGTADITLRLCHRINHWQSVVLAARPLPNIRSSKAAEPPHPVKVDRERQEAMRIPGMRDPHEPYDAYDAERKLNWATLDSLLDSEGYMRREMPNDPDDPWYTLYLALADQLANSDQRPKFEYTGYLSELFSSRPGYDFEKTEIGLYATAAASLRQRLAHIEEGRVYGETPGDQRHLTRTLQAATEMLGVNIRCYKEEGRVEVYHLTGDREPVAILRLFHDRGPWPVARATHFQSVVGIPGWSILSVNRKQTLSVNRKHARDELPPTVLKRISNWFSSV